MHMAVGCVERRYATARPFPTSSPPSEVWQIVDWGESVREGLALAL